MILFWFSIVVFIAAVIAALVAFGSSGDDRSIAAAWGGGLWILSLILLLFASVVSVGTKNVGVKLTFGKPSGYIQNGLHFKAPWQTVTELTDAIQTDTYASDGGAGGQQQGGAQGTCINVRVERQATACVNVSIRWQIKPPGVDYLFRNYKGNEAITDNLVLRTLQSAMNEHLATYDPLGVDQNGNNTNELLNSPNNGPSISRDVTQEMQHQLDQWIDVKSVFVPILNFDKPTQDKIGQLQSQIVQTRVSAQAIITNENQAKANKVLQQSLVDNPGALTDKCLNLLKEAVDKNQSIQGAPSCFSGTSTGVIVNGK